MFLSDIISRQPLILFIHLKLTYTITHAVSALQLQAAITPAKQILVHVLSLRLVQDLMS